MPERQSLLPQSSLNQQFGAGGACSTHGCYDGAVCPGCRDGLPRMCQHCRKRPATREWADDALAITHGWVQHWCEICVLEEQVEHARDRAAALPELERRLKEARDGA